MPHLVQCDGCREPNNPGDTFCWHCRRPLPKECGGKDGLSREARDLGKTPQALVTYRMAMAKDFLACRLVGRSGLSPADRQRLAQEAVAAVDALLEALAKGG